MLHIPEIRNLLYEFAPRDRWLQLREIYALVESRSSFDEEDLSPVTDRYQEPKWKRNVRAVLQEIKRDDIQWRKPAQYRFPQRTTSRTLTATGRPRLSRAREPRSTFDHRTFLLTWNPSRWIWDDLPSVLETMTISGVYRDRWSVGNRLDLPVGSRVFLMKLGTPSRGLVASGWSRTEPAQGRHWNTTRAERGDTTLGVEVDFDVLSPVPLITADTLRRAPFDAISWTPQASGIEIRFALAAALEEHWSLAAKGSVQSVSSPLEAPEYWEGSLRRTYENVFERDASARRACIAHYGSSCVVCGFSFPSAYGHDFDELVHVHHCVPLSTIREAYVVDPIRDLRPVCPNCHAALHQRAPPHTVEELRKFLQKASKGA